MDRHYIERFLAEHAADIRGRVLEVKNSHYTNRFGTAVTHRDVLDIDASNPVATIVADLSRAVDVPSESFDCILLTQTLQFIFDTPAALAHTCRLLRPGGVLLATVPGISRIAPRYGLKTDYWRFTLASCTALFDRAFTAEQVQVRAHGNVLTSIAFLTGMAREELSARELDACDGRFSACSHDSCREAMTGRMAVPMGVTGIRVWTGRAVGPSVLMLRER